MVFGVGVVEIRVGVSAANELHSGYMCRGFSYTTRWQVAVVVDVFDSGLGLSGKTRAVAEQPVRERKKHDY